MSTKFKTGFVVIQDIIKLKWVPEILEAIANGNSRYSDILEEIPNISHTELQRKLNILMDQDAITKVKNGTYSFYKLQEYGEDLIHIFLHFANINERYHETYMDRKRKKEEEKRKRLDAKKE